MATRGDLHIYEAGAGFLPKRFYQEIHCTINHDAYVDGVSIIFAQAYRMYKNNTSYPISLLNCLIATAPTMFEINEDRESGYTWQINVDNNTVTSSYDGEDVTVWTLESLADYGNSLLKTREDLQKTLNNFSEYKEYIDSLMGQYSKFITLSGVSMKNDSLYSNHLMMNDEGDISKLHITHDGKQVWEYPNATTAIEMLNDAYFPQIAEEWGLKPVTHEGEQSNPDTEVGEALIVSEQRLKNEAKRNKTQEEISHGIKP